MVKKRIIDAQADAVGRIRAVKFDGNRNFTPIETAIRMADEGQIANAHAVHPKRGKAYLRTNPDCVDGNNLETLASH